VYLDLNDGVKKRGKLTNDVGGAYEVLEVDTTTKTVVIQRGSVTERVSMNRVVRAPKSAPLAGPMPDQEHAATPKDLAEKNIQGKSWYFKSILDHRTLDDGSLQLRLDWKGYPPSWVPRADVAEESISRYFARLANERRKRRSSANVLYSVDPPVHNLRIPAEDCLAYDNHRFVNGDLQLHVILRSGPPVWASTTILHPSVVSSYIRRWGPRS